jgi:hypothetical protein
MGKILIATQTKAVVWVETIVLGVMGNFATEAVTGTPLHVHVVAFFQSSHDVLWRLATTSPLEYAWVQRLLELLQ